MSDFIIEAISRCINTDKKSTFDCIYMSTIIQIFICLNCVWLSFISLFITRLLK